MKISTQVNFNLDDFRLEDINTTEDNNLFVAFSDGGDIWIEFEFEYKFVEGCTEPQCKTNDYYQLYLTHIKKFENTQTKLHFILTNDTKTNIINYFNNDFYDRLKLDTDVLIDENYGL